MVAPATIANLALNLPRGDLGRWRLLVAQVGLVRVALAPICPVPLALILVERLLVVCLVTLVIESLSWGIHFQILL